MLIPNLFITSGMLLIFFTGNFVTNTNIYVEIEFLIFDPFGNIDIISGLIPIVIELLDDTPERTN